MSICNNMIEFGLDKKEIYEILEPKIKYYDLDENSIKGIKDYLENLNLLAYELEAGKASDIEKEIKDHQSISIIIGPEGGFDDSEVSYLKELSFKFISLGKRILRCETAAVYGLSVISYLLEKKVI